MFVLPIIRRDIPGKPTFRNVTYTIKQERKLPQVSYVQFMGPSHIHQMVDLLYHSWQAPFFNFIGIPYLSAKSRLYPHGIDYRSTQMILKCCLIFRRNILQIPSQWSFWELAPRKYKESLAWYRDQNSFDLMEPRDTRLLAMFVIAPWVWQGNTVFI